MDLHHFRKDFPHLEQAGIYFDHAAVSPLNRRSRLLMDTYLDQAQGEKINNYVETLETVETVRERIGRLISAPPPRVALVRNTSDGLILLARGLKWNSGDRIILHRREFPSNVYPWWELQPQGVKLDFIDTPDGRVTPEDLEPLVAVSWVQYFNGYRNSISELVTWCHERNILVAVDAMQGLGHLKMDVSETRLDFLSTGTAKWLLGPQGLGFVYLTEELQERLHPPHLGWQSRETIWDFHNYSQPLKKTAGRYEFATPFSMGIWWFSGSLDILLEADPVEIENRVLELSDYLTAGLRNLGLTLISNREEREHQSGIVAVSLPDKRRNQALFDELGARNIRISLRNDLLRIAPHFYNLEAEVDQFLKAVQRYQENHLAQDQP
ncbi:MAG: aminotransferase class V-fold PLP-dependent enzyme [Fidelibacterota bacterium]